MTQGPLPEAQGTHSPLLERLRALAREHFAPAAILLVGLAVATSAFTAGQNYLTLTISDRFAIPARNSAESIIGAFARYRDEMQGVVDFFHGTASVSREEFAAFATRLRARYPGIQTLSWLPRVLDDDRADFVQRARTQNGQFTAPRREVYYPSLYIDPPSFSNPGFDPFADPERRSVILSAANTGRPAVTGKIALANGSGFGVLVYAPILTVERRGAYDDVFRSMTSIVAGVFDLPALLEERLADLTLPLGEDVYL